ncbi:tautomerase family protein [Burkholderia guangdongensis]|uniref:tautomerase family protein n=1 Tax=Burkholderia guangdongensis TaxID=1792500 RepID=UPI0015C7100C|nr:tautomerase family protein [Burkholderia guangdongensis]
MPHVVVKLTAGRTEEKKAELANALAKTVVTILGCEDSAVSVGIEDIPNGKWLERVYDPDIRDKPETLYKKPGYRPAG